MSARSAPSPSAARRGAGAGVSTARKPKPRPAASYEPHACVVLAIDPGETSGWAVLVRGALDPRRDAYRCGVLYSTAFHTHRLAAISIARDASSHHGLPLIVVAEKWAVRWRPAGAPRESWGQWLAALDEAGIPRRRIVRVNVGKWSAKLLGSMALTTEQRQARSIAVAKARFGLDVTHDEAAALLMAAWASRAGEVANVLPRRKS